MDPGKDPVFGCLFVVLFFGAMFFLRAIVKAVGGFREWIRRKRTPAPLPVRTPARPAPVDPLRALRTSIEERVRTVVTRRAALTKHHAQVERFEDAAARERTLGVIREGTALLDAQRAEYEVKLFELAVQAYQVSLSDLQRDLLARRPGSDIGALLYNIRSARTKGYDVLFGAFWQEISPVPDIPAKNMMSQESHDYDAARRNWEARVGINNDPLMGLRTRTPDFQPYTGYFSTRYGELKEDVRRVLEALGKIEEVLISETVMEAARRIPRLENPSLYAPADPLRELEVFVALATPDVAAFEHDLQRIEAEYARLQIQAEDQHRLGELRR